MSLRWLLPLVLSLVLAAACSTVGDAFPSNDAGGGDVSMIGFDAGCMFGCGDAAGTLTITPTAASVAVTYGQSPSTLSYQAFLNGQPVGASWSLDRGDLGTVDGNGLFTPSGTVGGTGTLTATYQGATGSATTTVNLSWVQNGVTAADGGVVGPGGNGGVGGEGPGQPVSSTTESALQGTPVTDSGLAWLYPYNATVWPQGLLAPLLQWNVGAQGDYDAIYIHVHEAAFDYKGYFSKTAAPFIHHPIPQAPWDAMSYSNGGEAVTVDLVFSKGNVAYGPITETWNVAPGSLRGTVYYQSYATSLVQNYCCTTKGAEFGAAVLAIKHGATSPVVVAGSNGGLPQCRACHSVSVDGSLMIAAHGDNYATTSDYDLKTSVEQTMGGSSEAFGALAPNNTMVFTNTADINGMSPPATSSLLTIPGGSPISTTGMPSGLGAGTPTFSPDGKNVAFNLFGGTGADQKSLATMAFNGTSAFSGFGVLDKPTSGADIFPSYLPTSAAIVFERLLTQDPNGGSFGSTGNGATGELWWVDTASKTATALSALNGAGYLPTGPNNHGNDTQLNYEPTVNPVVSGGYAWIVFTSRRLYGNIATVQPYCSDPRSCDLTASPTPKKLWVAPFDINGTPGTDPSHPAFYLPAQELMASNSRGYWVVDPCQADGTTCETGDECCGGYCSASSDGGLVCGSSTNGCSHDGDKCSTGSNCCAGLACIDDRCAAPQPP